MIDTSFFPRGVAIPSTKVLSIFRVSMGSRSRRASEEYPVPKSSMATLTPAARSCSSFAISTAESSARAPSVISTSSPQFGADQP